MCICNVLLSITTELKATNICMATPLQDPKLNGPSIVPTFLLLLSIGSYEMVKHWGDL